LPVVGRSRPTNTSFNSATFIDEYALSDASCDDVLYGQRERVRCVVVVRRKGEGDGCGLLEF
jgi:hypothetical protein